MEGVKKRPKEENLLTEAGRLSWIRRRECMAGGTGGEDGEGKD